MNIRSFDFRDFSVQPVECLGVRANQVDVWHVALDEPIHEDAWKIVTPDEAEKARRFHFPRDRDRYLTGRAALRTILAHYLDTVPDCVAIDYEEKGKPKLADPARHEELRFNVSHSHATAIVGLTARREIGVDIEMYRDIDEFQSICSSFFSPQETSAINQLPDAERQTAFFRCWTSKEAYLKALGCGLSHPLDSFNVQVDPNKQPALLGVDADPNEAARWLLLEVPAPPSHIATLAVQNL